MDVNPENGKSVFVKQEENESETECFEELWDPNNDELPCSSQSDNLICGEVLLVCHSSYVLVCGLCTDQFYNLELFGDHFNTSHSSCIDTPNTNEMKSEINSTIFYASQSHTDTGECSQRSVKTLNSGEEDFKKRFDSTESLSTHLVEDRNNYNYSQCNKQSSNHSSYTRHIGIHSNEEKRKARFVCQPCGKDFKTRFNYNRHLKIHERHLTRTRQNMINDVSNERLQDPLQESNIQNNPEVEISLRSSISDNQSSYTRHIGIHSNEEKRKARFVCQTCGKDLKKKFNYNRHLKIHERHLTRTRQCIIKDIPNERLQDQQQESNIQNTPEVEISLRSSISDNHSSYTRRIGIRSKEENRKARFVCQTCGKDFKNKFTYKRHLEIHERYLTRTRQNMINDVSNERLQDPQQESNMQNTPEVEISLRSSSSDNHSSYTRRIGIRSNEEKRKARFVCQTCGKDLKKKFNYNRHLKMHERHLTRTSQNMIKDVSNDRLQDPTQESNIQNTPEVEISLMSSSSNNHSSYTRRIGVRSNEEKRKARFVCQPCGKDFKTRFNYNRHLKIHERHLTRTRQNMINDVSNERLQDPRQESNIQNTPEVEISLMSSSSNNHSTYTRHIGIHSNEEKIKARFVCQPCGKDFKNKFTYKRHLEIHERYLTRTRQNMINDVSNERLQDPRQESNIQNAPEVEISLMSSSSDNHSSYTRRIGVRSNEEKRKARFVCQTCGKDLKNKFNYNRHLKIHEKYLARTRQNIIKDISNERLQDQQESTIQNTPEAEINLRCSSSDMKTTTNTLKNDENDRHASFEATKTETLFNKIEGVVRENDETRDIESPDSTPNGTFKCKQCNREMNNRFAFNRHVESHLLRKFGRAKYWCRICDQRFVHKSSCNRHEKKHLEIALPFYTQMTMQESSTLGNNIKEMPSTRDDGEATAKTISETDQRSQNYALISAKQQKEMMEFFMQRPNLINNIPPNSNQFRCDECGKYFPTSYSLRGHYEIHRLRKLKVHKFKCQICEMGFLTRFNYTRHLKRHEKRKELKPSCERNDDVGVNTSS